MDRQIVCFGIPVFEVAVARLHDLSLLTRPVAIAPLNTSRALLREVSADAEQEGLAVGMSVEQARREISEYIELFYNRQRRHSRLGNCSPTAFAQQWARQHPAA